MAESTRERFLSGSNYVGMAPAKRSASTASLDRGISKRFTNSTNPDVILNPITRTPSAQFPMSRAPSRQGLSMIRTTEPSPPPTDLTFEEALEHLYKLEKRLRLELDNDIRDLRLSMTAKRIDYVSKKAQRLYVIRQQLGACRVLCKQEEEVMREFDKVKSLLERQAALDEDEYQRTKVDCLVLGGKLTDVRRRQRRLSGQVEDLESSIKDLIDQSQTFEDEDFDLEAFKRKPLPDDPKLAPTLPSYSLFNNAPFAPPIKVTYSSDSLAAFGASDDGRSDIPDNPSPVPSSFFGDRDSDCGKYYKPRDTTDFSQDEHDDGPYLPQSNGIRRKKKKRSEMRTRNTSGSSDTDADGEDFWIGDERMTADEAKMIAEAKQRQVEEEKRRDELEQKRIREEIEAKQKEDFEKELEDKRVEEEARLAELTKQIMEEEQRKQEELEAQRKAAEEKRIAFEKKKKEKEEQKKREEEEKKKQEAEKKKADVEAKRKAAAEKKKALEEKKKKEEEEKKKVEEEKKKKLEDKKKALEEKKRKEAEDKKAEEERKRKEDDEKHMEQQRIEEEKQMQLQMEEEERLKEQLRLEEEKRQEEIRIKEEQMRLEEERRQEAIRMEQEQMSLEEDRRQSEAIRMEQEQMRLEEERRQEEIGIEQEQIERQQELMRIEQEQMRVEEERQQEFMRIEQEQLKLEEETNLERLRIEQEQIEEEEQRLMEQISQEQKLAEQRRQEEIQMEEDQLWLEKEREQEMLREEQKDIALRNQRQKEQTRMEQEELSMEKERRTLADEVALQEQMRMEQEYEKGRNMLQGGMRLDDDQDYTMDQDSEQPVAPRKSAKKGRSASRDRQAASKLVGREEVEDDGMIFDEDQQIRAKEDLFAAIGNTSLKGGKFRRKKSKAGDESGSRSGSRSKNNSVSVYDDEMVTDQNKKRTPSGDKKELDVTQSARMTKSRTQSKERPGSQNMNQKDVLGYYSSTDSMVEKNDTAYQEGDVRDAADDIDADQVWGDNARRGAAKSRTASRERGPRGDHSEARSGASSRERLIPDEETPASAHEKRTNSITSSGDREPMVTDDRRAKSRTTSRERRGKISPDNDERSFGEGHENFLDRCQSPIEAEVKPQSRTASQERPPESGLRSAPNSRTASSDRQPQQRGGKSRTTSRERPLKMSDSQPPAEGQYQEAGEDYFSQPEVDPRTSSFDKRQGEFVRERDGLEDERWPIDEDSRPGGRERTRSGNLVQKSRTASRERVRNLEDELTREEFLEYQEMTLSEDPKEKLRRRFSDEPAVGFSDQGKVAKSRTSSRERAQDYAHYTAGDSEDIYAQVKPKLGRSRTSSKDSRSDHSQHDEELDDGEVPGLEAAPEGVSIRSGQMSSGQQPDDMTGSAPASRPKSRTSSRERPQTLEIPSREFQLGVEGQGARSRTASRERAKGQLTFQDIVQLDEEQLGQRVGKSRSVSGDRDETARERPRTSSRERPSSMHGDVRSRTQSRDRKGGLEYADDDMGYDTLAGGRLRRYKDEEALDLAAVEDRVNYDYDTLDSGIGDQYRNGSAAEAPEDRSYFRGSPTFDYESGYPDRLVVNPEYELTAEQEEIFRRQLEDEQGLDDNDDQQSRTRTKKVSFADTEEKIVLRPDPEVKVIPGTKLFCFGPSSTHEQPPEDQAMPRSPVSSTSSHQPLPKELNGATPVPSKAAESTNELQTPPHQEEKQLSSSPKSFLKAMLGKHSTSKESLKDGNGGTERRSLFDTLLKRGRSLSLQGSRSNSRQSSLDRGATSDKGFTRSLSLGVGARPEDPSKSGAPYGNLGSSRATDSSLGSADLDQEASDLESEYSLFKKSGKKKKKPKKVQTVDFDELFARGHAIEEQRERMNQVMNGGAYQHPTPFEVYSKEEAFKQTQQGAGISYEEKVKSYLDDQQHLHGWTGDQRDYYSQFSTESAGPARDHESRRAEKKLKRDRSRSDSNKRNQVEMKLPETPKIIGYAKPADIHIETPSEPIIQATPPSTANRPGSRLSVNSARPLDTEEFLHNMQEFVRRAEVDQEYSQPIWPAIVQSPNDLPPMKPQHKASSQSLGNISPRPISPRQNSFTQPALSLGQLPTGQDRRPVSPYSSQPDNFSSLQKMSADGSRLAAVEATLQRQASPYQMQGLAGPLPPARRPASPYQAQEPQPARERMAPSPGKSYLETEPGLKPDPFQTRVDQFDGPPPPTPAEAASLIMRSLFSETDTQKPTPSPRKGRSPRLEANSPRDNPTAGDVHLPAMLRPDPLTAHELQPPPIIASTLHTTQQLKLANGGEEEAAQTIKDTDLYRKLQEGLKNIDKIIASESFQRKLHEAELDHHKYSHHLGRAEFGVLKKRSGSTASVPASTSMAAPITKSASAAAISLVKFPSQRAGSVQQVGGSRDSSNERPASAAGNVSRYQPVTSRGRTSNFSSQQGSRDSSLGRPDSRMSNYSAMPDLEPGVVSGMVADHGHGQGHGPQAEVMNIEPHPEILERKREVLQKIADEKLLVKETKVWVQVFLLFIMCLSVLVYLQTEG